MKSEADKAPSQAEDETQKERVSPSQNALACVCIQDRGKSGLGSPHVDRDYEERG